ncbi:MAG: cbb3-type cytochrome oxidase assembly protein CcoS [Alphaproteobacteria bacterium]|jgi:cbb3-type cytochrome oxidase maturation protein|nr:cbb3-type cytochrome oxidase assembly protein CcoS [Candidatus Jidaibacter sp.]
MEIIIYLIPATLFFGALIIWALFWSVKNKQFDDLDGAATRILHDDD